MALSLGCENMRKRIANAILDPFRSRSSGSGSPVGCDITDTQIFLSKAKGRKSATLSRHSLDGEEPGSDAWWKSLSVALAKLVREYSLSGNDVVFCPPPFAALTNTVKLASMPQAELCNAAMWQLAKEMDVTASGLTCDVLAASGDRRSPDSNEIEVLAFAAQTPILCRIADTLQNQGLRPAAVDGRGCANARGLTTVHVGQGGLQEDILVALNFKRDCVELSIIRHGEPRLYRRLTRGEDWFDSIMAKRLKVTPQQVAEVTANPDQSLVDSYGQTISPKHLNDAASQSLALYGQELARELVMTIRHHMTVTHDGWPNIGFIQGPEQFATLGEVISGHCGIEFHADGQTPDGPWRCAIGLAHYFQTDAVKEVA